MFTKTIFFFFLIFLVWVTLFDKLSALVKSFLGANNKTDHEAVKAKKQISFGESIRQFINECEVKGNALEKSRLFMDGSFVAALNKARTEGKPLLIAHIPPHGKTR
jgi:hypothetical protein